MKTKRFLMAAATTAVALAFSACSDDSDSSYACDVPAAEVCYQYSGNLTSGLEAGCIGTVKDKCPASECKTETTANGITTTSFFYGDMADIMCLGGNPGNGGGGGYGPSCLIGTTSMGTCADSRTGVEQDDCDYFAGTWRTGGCPSGGLNCGDGWFYYGAGNDPSICED